MCCCRLGIIKTIIWFFCLLLTISLVAELFFWFTLFADSMGPVQQTNIGLKFLYTVPILIYTIGLICNRIEIILMYSIICLNCALTDTMMCISVFIGLVEFEMYTDIMVPIAASFEAVQAILALIGFFGNLHIYRQIKKIRKEAKEDVLKKYAFTRFDVLKDKDDD